MENDTLDLNEMFLIKIGSTWVLDTLYLYVLTTFSMIGIVLNIINLIVLCNKNIGQIRLYDYLKFYSLNSLIITIITSLGFYSHVPRYFEESLSQFSRISRCYGAHFGLTFFFYGNVLNILIIFERMSLYHINMKIFSTLNPYKVCVFSFFVCCLINWPTLLQYSIKSNDEFYQARTNYSILVNFTYCERTDFILSTVGKVIFCLIYFVRDILTLIIEILAYSVSLVTFKRYLRSKTHVLVLALTISNPSSSRIKRLERTNKNLTDMSISSALLSIICNCLTIFYMVVYYLFDNTLIFHYYGFFSTLIISIRYSLTFFFNYYYNLNFRNIISRKDVLNE